MDGAAVEVKPGVEVVASCGCVRCMVARGTAALRAERDELAKRLELLRNVHQVVVGHRDRLVESQRELRAELEYLRDRMERARTALE